MYEYWNDIFNITILGCHCECKRSNPLVVARRQSKQSMKDCHGRRGDLAMTIAISQISLNQTLTLKCDFNIIHTFSINPAFFTGSIG